MTETYGTCIYCGQSQIIRVPEGTDEGEKSREATKLCKCDEAKEFQKIEQSIDYAQAIIEEEYGADKAAAGLLIKAARPCAEHMLDKLTVTHGRVTYRLTRKKDGTLKLEKEVKTKEVKET